jgi:hypothetical protein
VTVRGLSGRELASLRRQTPVTDVWLRALRVTVAGSDSFPIAGTYSVADSTIEFRPLFPFDAGRTYVAVLDPAPLSLRRDPAQETFTLPAVDLSPSTRVTRILPGADVLPENQLRLYVEFSAPMSRDGGLEFVHLLDDAGKEVPGAFLPLDADFWNGDRTRYTLFLDPGRVKQGILPNQQMGRALRAGRRYSLRVDSAWRDGRGMPLVSAFTKSFRAGAADFKTIALADWTLAPPRAGTAEPLVVRFPEPLDHGLLRRAVGVADAAGASLHGDIEIAAGEREWRFTPRSPWAGGRHDLVVLEILEDLAGNRVNRAFEVDLFTRADSTSVASRFTIPFTVR